MRAAPLRRAASATARAAPPAPKIATRAAAQRDAVQRERRLDAGDVGVVRHESRVLAGQDVRRSARARRRLDAIGQRERALLVRQRHVASHEIGLFAPPRERSGEFFGQHVDRLVREGDGGVTCEAREECRRAAVRHRMADHRGAARRRHATRSSAPAKPGNDTATQSGSSSRTSTDAARAATANAIAMR